MPDSQDQGGIRANLFPAAARPAAALPRRLAWYIRPLARLLGHRRPVVSPASPYRVVCACGQVVSGQRQTRFQVVPCPACRANLFVLPVSPLPRPQTLPGEAGQAAAAPAPPRRRRRVVYVLGLAALLGITALALWSGLSSRPAGNEDVPAAARSPSRPRLPQAEQLLAQGQFHQALAACDAALSADDGPSSGERLALTQVRRQAALLADLSAESLEEILHHAAGLSPAEWAATFRQRYRGASLVLDTLVTRTADGHYHHGWHIFLPEGEARFDLDGLRLLESLPLEQPQRLVFGCRLQGARRGPSGVWVVRVAPDSGVLLTDPEAAALCCPALGDAASRDVLRRQRGWALDEPR